MTSMQPLWGPPTASVDWCEKNYEICNFVAEFWNTTTSSFIALLGLLGVYLTHREGLEKRFGVLYVGIVIVGLGSVAFHGTLWLGSQLLDELPMIWSTLTWLYIYQTMESPIDKNNTNNSNNDKRLAYFLTAFGVAWGAASPWVHYYAPLAFRTLFVGLLAYSLYKAYFYFRICENVTAKKLYVCCNVFLVAGVVVWLLDLHACNKLHEVFGNYWWHKYVGSLHGYWHCFMALNVYLGPTVTATIRAQMLDRAASIQWCMGVVPYVRYEKKKTLLLLMSGEKAE